MRVRKIINKYKFTNIASTSNGGFIRPFQYQNPENDNLYPQYVICHTSSVHRYRI